MSKNIYASSLGPVSEFQPEQDFVLRMRTVGSSATNRTISVSPKGDVEGGGVNVGLDCWVDWGDGSAPENFTTAGAKTHVYASEGEYIVRISGQMPGYGFPTSGVDGNTNFVDRPNRYLGCLSFGNVGLKNLINAFSGCAAMTELPDRLPSTLTNLNSAFRRMDIINCPNVVGWDTSNIVKMRRLWSFSSAFNQPIGGWDMSNVEDMSLMFAQADDFNQYIGDWDTSSATTMAFIFDGGVGNFATSFNNGFDAGDDDAANVLNWDTSNVAGWNRFASYSNAFNCDCSGLNTSSNTNNTDFDASATVWDSGRKMSFT